MASLINDPNGRRRIGFTDPDGKRQTLRLGKVPKRDADTIRVHVEHLLNARITGQAVAPDTARFVATLGDSLHAKLAAVGLLEPRAAAQLGPFLDNYIGRRTPTVKPNTVVNFKQARRYLVTHLGEQRDLRSITPANAED